MDSFDISRVGFDPLKHYSGVRMQQGRVVTDDDYNENSRIAGEQERRNNLHTIGSTGSPDNGFRIINLRHENGRIDFDISPGSIYVGGLRFEMDPLKVKERFLLGKEALKTKPRRKYETYRTQRDWLQQPVGSDHEPKFAPEVDRYDLVYLECWQQAVSAVEDSELLEEALGGPDTGVRLRNMRRVKMNLDIGEADCSRAWQKQVQSWKDNLMGTLNKENELVRDVKLKVSFLKDPVIDNLCSPSVSGGYLGAENQAIRVQLIDKDHFTWGFDNASPLYKVTVNNDIVSFISPLKDQQHWPLSGQVVEILPWSAVLPNGEKIAEMTGFMTTVKVSYNSTPGTIQMDKPLPSTFGKAWKKMVETIETENPDSSEYYFLRVWNRGSDLSSPWNIPFSTGTPVPLGNTGLAVTITGDERICSDFWVIAARPNTPDRVVPWKLEVAASPNGVRRFYAPLAILQWHDYGERIVGHVLHDCRKSFLPLTEQMLCCSYTVGDGINSRGDFDSVEEAVENLPPDGGRICILPGDHFANLKVFQKRNIQIIGCGSCSVIRPHQNQAVKPVFHFDACQKIELGNMSVVAIEGTAIHIVDRLNVPTSTSDILIRDNQILAFKNAITIRVKEDMPGDNDIRIRNNRIGMVDKEGGYSAVFCVGDNVLIEGNRIVVVSPPDPENPEDPRKPDDPGYTLFNPCRESLSFYASGFNIQHFVYAIFLYITGLSTPGYRIGYKSLGGIQVGSMSDRVRVVNNEIIGGAGNGITLGHLPEDASDDVIDSKRTAANKRIIARRLNSFVASVAEKENFKANFRSSLYEISIEGNRISHMGLSGISVVAYFNTEKVELMICLSDLSIYRNTIIKCAQQIPVEIHEKMQEEVAYGGITLASCDGCSIRENRIENNGINQFEPVCGIFIQVGDKIEIADNHILNNGPRLEDETLAIRKGYRGGIILKMTLKKYEDFSAQNLDLSSFDGMPAAIIQGNIVTQPLGFALFLVAMGPVTVTGNVFTSQGIDKTNLFSLLAGAVFILDLGISKDFLVTLAFRFRNFTALEHKAVTNNASATTIETYNQLQHLPSGNVLFSENQTTIDLRDKTIDFSMSSQLIASFDDIAFNGNQSECLSYLSKSEKIIDAVLANTFLVGITVRSNNNRFQEGTTISKWSLLSFGYANIAIGNHSSHCLHIISQHTPDPLVLAATNYVLLDAGCNEAFELIWYRYMKSKEAAIMKDKPVESQLKTMNTPASNTASTGIEQDLSKLDASFDLLETQKANGLKMARDMTSIKNQTLAFESERLRNKYAPNHGQILKISKQISYNKEYIKSLDIELTNINNP